MNQKLKVKDYMTIGVYSALYFLCVALGTFIGVVLFHNGHMTLAPIFSALLGGIVYMVLVKKTQKFGAITIVGTVMGAFFLLTGHFVLSFIPNIIFAILADIIAKRGEYHNRLLNLWSYVVFSFGNLGPILLMWIARDAYIARLVEKGKDATYIQNVMVEFTMANIAWIFVGMIVMGLLGGLFGQYIVKKHFEKASV